jgi:hypothetical protein
MIAGRTWFELRYDDGALAVDTKFSDIQLLRATARDVAETTGKPLLIMKCSTEVFKVINRTVTLAETDPVAP